MLTIGVVGSLNWNEKYQTCYGNDVDVVSRPRLAGEGHRRRRRNWPPHLREKAERLGVADRVVFTGMIPHSAMPDYICALDICLSTQTPDEAGKMRTTSKMAEYLACNRYVISSDVGGNARNSLEGGYAAPLRWVLRYGLSSENSC
jgi:glycosyltransferase involved in cell wall biosynthesis